MTSAAFPVNIHAVATYANITTPPILCKRKNVNHKEEAAKAGVELRWRHDPGTPPDCHHWSVQHGTCRHLPRWYMCQSSKWVYPSHCIRPGYSQTACTGGLHLIHECLWPTLHSPPLHRKWQSYHYPAEQKMKNLTSSKRFSTPKSRVTGPSSV